MSSPEDTAQQPDSFSAISSTTVGGDLSGDLPDPILAAIHGTPVLTLLGQSVGNVLVLTPEGELSVPTWVPGTPSAVAFRKGTDQQIINTIAETDLLNGEIVLPGALHVPAWKGVRLTAWGDLRNFSGAAQALPRFKLKLGAAVLLDTGSGGAVNWASNAGRFGWKITAEIINRGVNAQWATLDAGLGFLPGGAGAWAFVVGEGWYAAPSGASQVRALGAAAGAVNPLFAQALVLSVILPVANANLDVTLKAATVEYL
jgi:hypothetical protein